MVPFAIDQRAWRWRSPGSEITIAACEPQRVEQTPGQECWKFRQPGHLRRDCPLMEVGQVLRVTGAPALSLGPGGTYSIPYRNALVDTGCT